jgi:metallophosphoesterase (TIGR00282 family)
LDQILNVCFLGDINSQAGRKLVREFLPKLAVEFKIDLFIANVENAAGGFGITPAIAREFLEQDIGVLTSGNHIWDKKEIYDYIPNEPRLLRPANYPPGVPGSGSYIAVTPGGVKVGVLNLSGRVFMRPLDCPFRRAEEEVKRLRTKTRVIIIDFHAEATSEKVAFGHYMDGSVSAVIGTHTHIPTADETILPKGTAYITDVGMTGAHDSIIGVKKECATSRFLTQINVRLEPARSDPRLNAVILEIDPQYGRAKRIQRVQLAL